MWDPTKWSWADRDFQKTRDEEYRVKFVTFFAGEGWQFVRRISGDEPFMNYTNVQLCSQRDVLLRTFFASLVLPWGCEMKGMVIHQIFKLLGIRKESSRVDRDKWLNCTETVTYLDVLDVRNRQNSCRYLNVRIEHLREPWMNKFFAKRRSPAYGFASQRQGGRIAVQIWQENSRDIENHWLIHWLYHALSLLSIYLMNIHTSSL